MLGSLAYACTIDHGRSKFDPRGKQCVYLGVSKSYKGHIMLDFHTQNLFISRDVIEKPWGGWGGGGEEEEVNKVFD